MQLLIHGHVVTELFSHSLIHRLLEMSSLSRIEYLTKDVLSIGWSLSRETYRLTKSPRNDLTEKLIFDAVIQED